MKNLLIFSTLFFFINNIVNLAQSISENNLEFEAVTQNNPIKPTATTNIFEKTFGSVGPERGIAIDVTLDDGIIIAGSTISFSSDEMMYVIRLDSTGALQWSKVYNSFGYSKLAGVKQLTDGGYYLTGFMDGGFGLFDHVIMKINNLGGVVWAKNFGGIEADELRKMSLTPDGGLLTSGYNASFGIGAKDIQAIKLLSNGTIEWAKTYGTLYEDFGGSNIIASDGNYILLGSVDISGFYDIRPTLTKLDVSGDILWAKYYSGFNEDWARNLIETPDGGFLIAGDTRSYGLNGSMDIYLIKTNSIGIVEWAKSYGGLGSETGYSVVLSSDGKYVIAGYTNSFGFGSYDGFLMKLDVNGSLEWFHTYGGNTADYIYDMIETPDQGFALTGRRSSNTLGGDDVYLIKTDADGYSSCDFGTFTPNVFTISNLNANNLNMGTLSFISESNLTLTTLTPNSGQNISCAIIPVELKSFNYEFENNDVILNWITASETNNVGFNILRDGEDLGFIAGAGTSTELHEYSFKDENVKSGTYFYSLIQTDFDGTNKKIGELEVVVDNIPSVYKLIQNYPNPFNPSTIIQYSIPENISVQLIIYNSLGEEVSVLVEGLKEAGIHEIEFDGSKLPSGIYFYSLSTTNFISTRKMILIK